VALDIQALNPDARPNDPIPLPPGLPFSPSSVPSFAEAEQFVAKLKGGFGPGFGCTIAAFVLLFGATLVDALELRVCAAIANDVERSDLRANDGCAMPP